jgi:hypothetical protein
MNELLNYISDQENPEANFLLGRWYEDQGHTSAAAGFYVRTAEYSRSDLLCYESLCRLAGCFTRQGSRVFLTKGLLLRAISLMPERPEAYFLLSELYERNREWQESFSFAKMGKALRQENVPSLRTNVGYPGAYGFEFEEAVSAWWIGLRSYSMHLFRGLADNPSLQPQHLAAVKDNLARLGGDINRPPMTYVDSMYERVKVKFPGLREIKRNYSQCFQDLFVLTMLNGKRDGVFFEIGCGDPKYGSNTKLLEELGWKGTSIDIDPAVTEKFHAARRSYVITGDATRLDYDKLIERDFDYLQIDCDPASQSLETLFRIPFEKRKFAVITFEHDGYANPSVRERSRAYLRSHGYFMIAGNIAADDYMPFEDWWILPSRNDPRIVNQMSDYGEESRRADLYMLQ